MTSVQEFLDREAESWAAFEARVAGVGADRREVPGVVGDWTLKDVVWHCAAWARFAADHLDAAKSPFVDPFDAHSDEHWDAVNAEIARTSSTMAWDDVVAGAADARTRLRASVTREGLETEPVEWAADESWIHYDEHAEHVAGFAHRPAG